MSEIFDNSWIRDVINPDMSVRHPSKSRILQGHFGVLPGVLGEEIALRLSHLLSGAGVETSFVKKIVTGDTLSVKYSDNYFSLMARGNGKPTEEECIKITPAEHIHHLMKANTEDLPVDVPYSSPDELDKHLLQSGDFRLASGGMMNESGRIHGHFTVPEDHIFCNTKNTLPYSFMKEVANQVMSLAWSKKNNLEGVKKGKVMLLGSAHVNFINPYPSTDNPVLIRVGQTLKIVAQVIGDDPKRPGVVYTGYHNEKPIMRGEVSGIVMSTKALFR